MKKLLTSIIVATFFVAIALGQAPKGIKYQTVVRDADGKPISNQLANITLKILQGGETGNVVCSETFTPTTNEFGLVNLEIGSINPSAFSTIDWSDGPYFTKVELNGNEMGTSELLSVPYSLYSEISNNSYWDKIGTSIFYNGGNVGIGKLNPEVKLDVEGEIVGKVVDQFAIKALNMNGQRIFGMEIFDGGTGNQSGNLRVFDDANFEAIRLCAKSGEDSWIANNGAFNIRINEGSKTLKGITIFNTNSNGYSGSLNFKITNQYTSYVAADITAENHDNTTTDGGNLYFRTAAKENSHTLTTRMKIDAFGNVGIGTTNPTHKLSVNGTIRSKEIIVNTGWSDYVFDDDYTLMPLGKLEEFIQCNKHLPDIPTYNEVEMDGISLGAMDSKLLQKVEELTLYIIELKKEIDILKGQIGKKDL